MRQKYFGRRAVFENNIFFQILFQLKKKDMIYSCSPTLGRSLFKNTFGFYFSLNFDYVTVIAKRKFVYLFLVVI